MLLSMKSIRIPAFILIALVVSVSLSASEVRTVTIDDGWKFRQARYGDWYPATVPGTVHTDLMANGLIEDPYYGMNERSVQWVDKEDWVYETVFDLGGEIYSSDHIEIEFEGLDTYADVYLNDSLLFSAENMFRRWRADIKSIAVPEGNRLRVYLHSPVKVDLPETGSWLQRGHPWVSGPSGWCGTKSATAGLSVSSSTEPLSL